MTKSITLKSSNEDSELSIKVYEDGAICINSLSKRFTHHEYMNVDVNDIKELRDFLNIILNEEAKTVQ